MAGSRFHRELLSMHRSDDTAEARPKLYQVAGIFRERLPAAALRGHVDRVWSNEIPGPAALEVVPDGCIDIYWTRSGLHVAGPNTQVVTATVASAASLVGVRFRPGVAHRWLRVSAAELLDAHPLLEEIWGSAQRRRFPTSSRMRGARMRPRRSSSRR